MFTDSRIVAALETMVRRIDAPPVPLQEIQRRIAEPRRAVRHIPRYLQLTAATAVIIAIAFLALPANSLGLGQTIIAASYRAALHVIGWTPPPPAPKPMALAVSSQNGTLAAAQSQVPFRIVAPRGLPEDVVSSRIRTSSGLVYSKQTHVWRVGSRFVTFTYRRAGGRTFTLLADKFDARTGPPPKYMFLSNDLPGGRVALVKQENFAWRNGDQIMTVTEGDGINAREIQTIRTAMHGIAVPEAEPGHLHTGTLVKQYRIRP